MHINICTLSLSDEYNNYTAALIHSLGKSFIRVNRVTVVTDDPNFFDNMDTGQIQLNLVRIRDVDYSKIKLNGYFNYNLKRLAICEEYKLCTTGDILIWLDCDTLVLNNETETFIENIKNLADTECFATRPSRIGDMKKEIQPLGGDKMKLFGVYETYKYDDAHCINEQVLAMRASHRVGEFLDKWAELSEICDGSNLPAHTEGIEMGIALEHAGIKPKFIRLPLFYFYSNKTGNFFSYG